MTIADINNASGQGCGDLNFADIAKGKFAFLRDLGFAVIESSPTIVRFRKGDIQVDVYQEPYSYEMGLGVTWMDVRYELQDFIVAIDPEAIKEYYVPIASTKEGVAEGLTRLSELARRYCGQALQGELNFFVEVAEKNKSRTQEYWLERRARQLRPEAEEAFRLGRYRQAAELYKQIESVLSPSERKRLAIAEERSKE